MCAPTFLFHGDAPSSTLIRSALMSACPAAGEVNAACGVGTEAPAWTHFFKSGKRLAPTPAKTRRRNRWLRRHATIMSASQAGPVQGCGAVPQTGCAGLTARTNRTSLRNLRFHAALVAPGPHDDPRCRSTLPLRARHPARAAVDPARRHAHPRGAARRLHPSHGVHAIQVELCQCPYMEESMSFNYQPDSGTPATDIDGHGRRRRRCAGRAAALRSPRRCGVRR